ncbi:transporter substrate-binding domain-containing protein [Bradyrhizobium sp. 183]|uniref:substrate-binding periplasmic protein n=1 Tax=unclassified Bradyrhizobium TaxID=2631580 RepID=UPI001FFE9697|nr:MULTISPECIES: transporter substrate-binding domain-containing protein [unclassified Bradyrhizobium]UPJ79301.1 transporter substrate-binding domain-containing protein [Bradyrhizobium sp. 184]UPJ87095.1 transporter substrate-binding domain-containing protein [Bradyrhizobium sp. 183]
MRKLIGILLVAVAGALVLADMWSTPTQANPQFKLVEPAYLTVATYGSAPPSTIIQPGDVLGGVNGYWLNQFAQAHGLKVKLFQTDFASGLIAVQQGKADVQVQLAYTPQRTKTFYFTRAFWASQVGVFTPSGFAYVGTDSLKGKRVGTIAGYIWADYVKGWCASCLTLFPNSAAAATALLNGQIDALISGQTTLLNAPLSANLEKVNFTPLKTGDFGFPADRIRDINYNVVSCSNAELGKAMDATLADLQTSGKWAKAMADMEKAMAGLKLLPANDTTNDPPPVQGCQ